MDSDPRPGMGPVPKMATVAMTNPEGIPLDRDPNLCPFPCVSISHNTFLSQWNSGHHSKDQLCDCDRFLFRCRQCRVLISRRPCESSAAWY